MPHTTELLLALDAAPWILGVGVFVGFLALAIRAANRRY